MLGLVVSTVLVLVAGWLALALALVLARPRGLDLTAALRVVPDVVRLVSSLVRDRSLGWGIRVGLLLLLAYLASPIDLIPDVVPVLGQADDVIVAAIALRAVVRHAGPAALDGHWRGTDAGLRLVRRLAGCPIPESSGRSERQDRVGDDAQGAVATPSESAARNRGAPAS